LDRCTVEKRPTKPLGYGFFIKARALRAVKEGETLKAILGIPAKMVLILLALINIASNSN
jgi:hypothetical protein